MNINKVSVLTDPSDDMWIKLPDGTKHHMGNKSRADLAVLEAFRAGAAYQRRRIREELGLHGGLSSDNVFIK